MDRALNHRDTDAEAATAPPFACVFEHDRQFGGESRLSCLMAMKDGRNAMASSRDGSQASVEQSRGSMDKNEIPRLFGRRSGQVTAKVHSGVVNPPGAG